MGNYNLGTLDPTEFEAISADILSIVKDSTFRTFKAGPDGGIDALELKNGQKVICQSKRYNDFNNLFQALKDEKEKIERIPEIEEYYLFTSCRFNPKELNKVFNLFSDYMKSYENIYDGNVISSFLDDPKYFNVLMKHPCLWLSNASILEHLTTKNLLIDAEVLLDDIIEKDKYYVDNSYYKRCKELILKNNCLLVLGAPGVGKSTISNKIVLYLLQEYKSKNMQLRYSSRYEYEELKKTISMDPNVFEIIYLDDFVGKVCLDINERDTSGLMSLIKYIKSHKNKFLIMNSRIAILKNKFEKDSQFKKCIRDNDISMVEIDDYSDIEKARIFFKRLQLDVPIEYRSEIKKDDRYWNIIKHPNYNPRLIENMCHKDIFNNVSPNDYYMYVINMLNNPKDIWKEEYRNTLEREDKILLDVIFSLANKEPVDFDFVEKAFYHVIKKEGIKENGDNLFNNSIERLADSYIRIFFINDNNKRRISLINNSLFDYFNEMVEHNPVYKSELLDNSIFSDQLIKITMWDLKEKCNDLSVYDYINDKLSDDYISFSPALLKTLKIRDFYDYDKESNYTELAGLLFEGHQELKTNYYVQKFVYDVFEKGKNAYLYKSFIEKSINNVESFKQLCSSISYDNAAILLRIWQEHYEESYEENFDFIDEAISDNYQSDFYDIINDVVSNDINDAIKNCEHREKDYFEPGSTEDVKNELIQLASNDLEDKCNIFFDCRLDPKFTSDDVEFEVDRINIEEEIRDYYYEPDYKSVLEDRAYDSDYDSEKIIDGMFSHLLDE